MLTATFIFRPASESGDFLVLNDEIDAVAEAMAGFLGRKRWADDGGNIAVVYYWNSKQSLNRFRKNSTHQLAKSRYKEWYAGFRVEISTVEKISGDGFFDSEFPGLA